MVTAGSIPAIAAKHKTNQTIMKNFKASKFNEVPREEVSRDYLSFYNEALKGKGIRVYFDNVSFSNGMSVYISFVKEGSEILQVRHSDHSNGYGSGVHRGFDELKTSSSLLPSEFTANRVIEILEKYKD